MNVLSATELPPKNGQNGKFCYVHFAPIKNEKNHKIMW